MSGMRDVRIGESSRLVVALVWHETDLVFAGDVRVGDAGRGG